MELTYSDLRHWYLAELHRVKQARRRDNQLRNARERRDLLRKLLDLRRARHAPSDLVVLHLLANL